jgi:hypothetical protein
LFSCLPGSGRDRGSSTLGRARKTSVLTALSQGHAADLLLGADVPDEISHRRSTVTSRTYQFSIQRQRSKRQSRSTSSQYGEESGNESQPPSPLAAAAAAAPAVMLDEGNEEEKHGDIARFNAFGEEENDDDDDDDDLTADDARSVLVSSPASASSYQSPAASTSRVGESFVIYTTGHSLGGALSMLAAYDLTMQFKKITVENYTYGSPRVGNHGFADLYDAVVPRSYRIVNDRDIITGFPKLLCFFFCHVVSSNVRNSC